MIFSRFSAFLGLLSLCALACALGHAADEKPPNCGLYLVRKAHSEAAPSASPTRLAESEALDALTALAKHEQIMVDFTFREPNKNLEAKSRILETRAFAALKQLEGQGGNPERLLSRLVRTENSWYREKYVALELLAKIGLNDELAATELLAEIKILSKNVIIRALGRSQPAYRASSFEETSKLPEQIQSMAGPLLDLDQRVLSMLIDNVSSPNFKKSSVVRTRILNALQQTVATFFEAEADFSTPKSDFQRFEKSMIEALAALDSTPPQQLEEVFASAQKTAKMHADASFWSRSSVVASIAMHAVKNPRSKKLVQELGHIFVRHVLPAYLAEISSIEMFRKAYDGPSQSSLGKTLADLAQLADDPDSWLSVRMTAIEPPGGPKSFKPSDIKDELTLYRRFYIHGVIQKALIFTQRKNFAMYESGEHYFDILERDIKIAARYSTDAQNSLEDIFGRLVSDMTYLKPEAVTPQTIIRFSESVKNIRWLAEDMKERYLKLLAGFSQRTP